MSSLKIFDYINWKRNAKDFEELLSSGADTNCRGCDDVTPLHHLANCLGVKHLNGAKVLKRVRLLLSHGADPDARDVHGQTPLMKFLNVASEQSADCAGALLEHGADVNIADAKGDTALHHFPHLEANMRLDVLFALLQRSKVINAKNRKGKTPLVELVRRAGSPGAAECLRAMLEAGADATFIDRRGNTLLHFCGPSPESVRMLARRGAPIDVKNARGKTPLMKYLEDDYDTECARTLLLDNNADVFATDKNGNGVLLYFVNCKKDGNLGLLETIIDYGIDPNRIIEEKKPFALKPLLFFIMTERSAETIELFLMNGARIDASDAAILKRCYDSVHITSAVTASLFKYSLLHGVNLVDDLNSGELWLLKNLDAITAEIARLKTERLGDLSYHDFCTVNDRRKLGRLYGSIPTVRDVEKQFPFFHRFVAYKYETAGRWCDVLTRVEELPLWSGDITLNSACLEHILSFLTNQDLVNLSLSGCGTTTAAYGKAIEATVAKTFRQRTISLSMPTPGVSGPPAKKARVLLKRLRI